MNTNPHHQMQSKPDTRTSRIDWRIYLPTILLILASLALTGCEVLQAPPTNATSVARAPKYPPNYDTPEGNFVAASFSKLASEFLDEYANQYVVFECRYQSHRQGAFVMGGGRPLLYRDIMSAQLMSEYKGVEVLWSVEDRELGRPFVEAKMSAPLRIYAFVLPAQKPWSLKGRRDIYSSGFVGPVILLIKAVPL